MEQLKNCPFCGGKAEIQAEPSCMTRYAFDTQEEAERMVKYCEKHIIPAQISSRKGEKTFGFYVETWPYEYAPRCLDVRCVGHYSRKFLSQEKAAEAWNRRA